MTDSETAKIVLEAKDYITFVSITITLIIGIVSLIVSWKTNKKTTYINTITSARIEWIQSVRHNISTLCSLAQAMNAGDTDYKEINYRIEMVKLLLNPAEEESKMVVELIGELPNAVSDGKVYEHSRYILESTQKILKKEWDRVKEEAQSGAKGK